MANLTALQVKAAKSPGRYQDGDGLMLVVKPSGSRSWALRVQVNGKRREFGLGSAKDISLAEARAKAHEVRALYRSGVDPAAARRVAEAQEEGIPSFEVAARLVHAEHSPGWRNQKHAAQWISSLERYAFPFIGPMPVDEIESPQIRDLLIPIWLDKPETARRVRQRVGIVLDWAHAKGYRASEAPMRSLSRGLPRQPRRDTHFAALPYADCPSFITELNRSDTAGRLALRLTILTAARSGEIRGATWSEIDFDGKLWSVPADRMKARREHLVPLSAGALAILSKARELQGSRPGELVFRGRGGRPLSDMTLTKVLRDMGQSKITVHGFRSSFRDWAAEQTEYAGDVVEAALAHAIQNRVEAAYRRTNYLEKRRALMDDWAAFLSTP